LFYSTKNVKQSEEKPQKAENELRNSAKQELLYWYREAGLDM
jgi:hypothetical protein